MTHIVNLFWYFLETLFWKIEEKHFQFFFQCSICYYFLRGQRKCCWYHWKLEKNYLDKLNLFSYFGYLDTLFLGNETQPSSWRLLFRDFLGLIHGNLIFSETKIFRTLLAVDFVTFVNGLGLNEGDVVAEWMVGPTLHV